MPGLFTLHPTLVRDSVAVFEDDNVMVRLINDARYPWVIIVPKVADVRELHELSNDMFDTVMELARSIGLMMEKSFRADKINTAAIGNMVPQLHVHVVARNVGDVAWPGPVWGVGEMQPLDPQLQQERVSLIRDGLKR